MSRGHERDQLDALLAAVESRDAPPFELRRLTPREAVAAEPEFAPLVELWQGRRGEAETPDWRDVGFEDFRGWHSGLMLSQLGEGEPDPCFRLIGEDYRLLHDSSVPGQRFSELMPRLYALQFREHFREIRDCGRIGLVVGPAAFVGREHIHLTILELPFRLGGARVERLLHVLRLGAAAAPG